MKILLLTDGIMPFVLGGMQKHSSYLAKYLSELGFDVTLVHCVNTKRQIPNEHEINKYLFDGEAKLDKIIGLKFPSSFNFPGHYIYNSYRYSKRVYDVIIDIINEYDFIYIKGFSGWKLLKKKLAGLKTPPIGIKFHGMNMFLPVNGLKPKLAQYLLRPPVRYNMKAADFIFSYGGLVTEVIIKTGIDKGKIIEIPTAIESHWIKDAENIQCEKNIQFVFVGRYDTIKGIKELNQAISLIRHQNFHFHFIGPFPIKNQIKNKNVFYHGHVFDLEDIKKVMDKSDVLILPSFSEGMPNVILEAMARGLAIIATNVGANSLMVNNDNGLLLNSTDIDLIKKAIEKFIKMDKNELLAKKKRSIEKVKKSFLWSEIALKTKKMIDLKIVSKVEK